MRSAARRGLLNRGAIDFFNERLDDMGQARIEGEPGGLDVNTRMDIYQVTSLARRMMTTMKFCEENGISTSGIYDYTSELARLQEIRQRAGLPALMEL